MVGADRDHRRRRLRVRAALAARACRTTAALPRKWLPDWHIGLVWRLGALFCCINAIYFSANAFMPIYLASQGGPDLISGALLALNLGQLPASLLLLAVAGRLERRAWPYVASGRACRWSSLAASYGWSDRRRSFWAALLGFSDAAALILGLTLPPLLCRPEDVARTSAGTFTLSYGGAVVLALLSGAAWDLSGMPALAFVPLAVCAVALAVITVKMWRSARIALTREDKRDGRRIEPGGHCRNRRQSRHRRLQIPCGRFFGQRGHARRKRSTRWSIPATTA